MDQGRWESVLTTNSILKETKESNYFEASCINIWFEFTLMRGCVATFPEDAALASNIARNTTWQGHVIKKPSSQYHIFAHAVSVSSKVKVRVKENGLWCAIYNNHWTKTYHYNIDPLTPLWSEMMGTK
jgi:hypothetical protein